MSGIPRAEGSEIRVVLITAPAGAVAKRIAETLVGEGLAACVNLVPGVQSAEKTYALRKCPLQKNLSTEV